MSGGTHEQDGPRAAAQLELDLERRSPLVPRLARGALAFARGVGRRAPLWIPLVLLAQVLVSGWLPTRAESRRLDRAEAQVLQRVEALEAESRRIDDEERMLDDEIYRERVRKSLLDPGREPLRLEAARRP